MKTIEELGISPSPWEYDFDKHMSDVVCHLESGIEYQVASVYIHSDEETDANANLIKAAPDLYDALYLQCFGNNGTTNCRNCEGAKLGNCIRCPLGKARAALAKASGEEGEK